VWRGQVACAADGRGTVCALQGGGQSRPERCNGDDDDCDGRVDDRAEDSVWVEYQPGRFMMKYEASRPDADANDSGIATNRACSKAGVLPWVNVTPAAAEQACAAIGAGVVLCDDARWQAACRAQRSCAYSYGGANCTAYQTTACNGIDMGIDDAMPSGDAAACYATPTALSGTLGLFDMSGNVREITAERSDGRHVLRGGSYNNLAFGMRCDFGWTVVADDFFLANTGFRCCYDGSSPPDPGTAP
jgi:formylglycine-generating enzyme required for sulfatase activity